MYTQRPESGKSGGGFSAEAYNYRTGKKYTYPASSPMFWSIAANNLVSMKKNRWIWNKEKYDPEMEQMYPIYAERATWDEDFKEDRDEWIKQQKKKGQRQKTPTLQAYRKTPTTSTVSSVERQQGQQSTADWYRNLLASLRRIRR